MNATVAQLTIVQVSLLGSFTGQLGYAGYGFTLAFVLLDFVSMASATSSMDVQVVVDLLFHEVADILVDAFAVGGHLRGAQLDLGLTFKDWFLYVDGNGGNQSVANVAIRICQNSP